MQLVSSWKGNKDLKKRFLIIYSLGVTWLVIDAIKSQMNDIAVLNLITLVVTLLILIKISGRLGLSDYEKEDVKRTVKKKRRK